MSVTLNGGVQTVRVTNLEVIIGHGGRHRLFALGAIGNSSVVFRIDPVSGRIELHWSVDDDIEALTEAGNDRLLITFGDRLEEYSSNGHLLRVVAANLQATHCLHESSLRPDSTITRTLPK